MQPTEFKFNCSQKNYVADLEKGISISGESQEYFAQRRIKILSDFLAKQNVFVESAMDYGCGTGTSVPYLLKNLEARHIVGGDISAALLKSAQDHFSNDRVSFCNTSNIEFDAEFDVIYCNGVFHHISPQKRLKSVQYVCKALKPDGYFSFWENNPWSLGARLVMSRIPFDKDAIMVWPNEIRRLLCSAGLAIVSTKYAFVFPKQLSWLRILEPWFRYVPLGAQYNVIARKLPVDNKINA